MQPGQLLWIRSAGCFDLLVFLKGLQICKIFVCLQHLMSKVLILLFWSSPDQVCLALPYLTCFSFQCWSDVWRTGGKQLRNHLSSQDQEVQLWLVQFRVVLIARLVRSECFPLASLVYYEFIPSLHAHWVSESWYQIGICCHRFPVISTGQDADCVCILCVFCSVFCAYR